MVKNNSPQSTPDPPKTLKALRKCPNMHQQLVEEVQMAAEGS